MKSLRKLRTLGLALTAGLLVSACQDDDPTGPATVPGVPGGIAASALGPSTVRVAWSPVDGASGYVVERAAGASGGSFEEVGAPTDPTFDDDGLEAGTTYRYRVAATGPGGASAFSGEAVVTTGAPGEALVVLSEDITSDRTLHADTVYKLSGFIKVGNGATLTIQPGTKIVGDYAIPGSSLFILRGSKIDAQGTEANPIVFTSERAPGQRQPGDWGGVILIGNGITNRGAPTYIEGTGTDEQLNPLQDYSGGTDNDDDSGIIRYTRIEFAGFPTAPNEELNSLTMAAVGRGTTIDHVQVLLGLDDSFEWFGGAVDATHLISYEAGDDHFDASEGYVGRLQHLIAFQSIRPEPRPNLAGGAASDPQGIENDGCWAENCNAGNDNRGASEPYTVPVFANFTLVGAEPGAWDTPSGNIGMMLRRGTGGLYVNGVVARYARAGVSLRGQEVRNRLDDGLLALSHIYFTENAEIFQSGDPTHPTLESRQFALDLGDHALEDGSEATADLFLALPTTTSSATADDFDWRPAPGSPIATGGLTDFSGLPAVLRGQANGAITPTAYRGAADPAGGTWWAGWTYYARF